MNETFFLKKIFSWDVGKKASQFNSIHSFNQSVGQTNKQIQNKTIRCTEFLPISNV